MHRPSGDVRVVRMESAVHTGTFEADFFLFRLDLWIGRREPCERMSHRVRPLAGVTSIAYLRRRSFRTPNASPVASKLNDAGSGVAELSGGGAFTPARPLTWNTARKILSSCDELNV